MDRFRERYNQIRRLSNTQVANTQVVTARAVPFTATSLCLGLLLFSCSAVFSSLRSHGLQHARPPCPPPSPGACSNSCPLSQRCHATISSSVVPFSSCPQSFPELGSFPMSCSSHQVVKYWSFSFSTSSFNEYSRLISFRTDWFDLLAVQETLKRLFQHHSLKASIFQHSAFFTVQLSHPYMTTGEKKKFRQC